MNLMFMTRALQCACCLSLVTAAGCAGPSSAGSDDGRLEVLTSFYPLEYAVEQIGGEHVVTSNLTKPGTEAHDLELTPRQVLGVKEADQLIYLGDFQPAVDDAAAGVGDAAFDVAPAAHLDLEPAEGEGGHDHEEHGDHEGHDHGGVDPHFWLDPTRYAHVGEAIGERLAKADPEHASDYRANAKDFGERLHRLDGQLRSGLADCERHELVTGHASFGYFADRYGFTQEPIAGLSPHDEPSPQDMAGLIHHIRDEGIETVYTEPQLPAALAETIADDSDATVAVLDPIEGISEDSEGSNYFQVMRSNLASVQEGAACA